MNIYIIILSILIIILFIRQKTLNKKQYERATNTTSFTDEQLKVLNNKISTIYNKNIESIRNLGSVSKSLLTGINYHNITPSVPGILTIPSDNTIFEGEITVDKDVIVNNDLIVMENVTFNGKDSQTFTMNIMAIGTIIAFAKKIIPKGWAICDGTLGTPDLRGRFILGGSLSNTKEMSKDMNLRLLTPRIFTGINIPSMIGGEEKHTLTMAEMPKHNHANNVWIMNLSNKGSASEAGDRFPNRGVKNPAFPSYYTGGGDLVDPNDPNGPRKPVSHNNMPPYYLLLYIMKIS